MLRVLILRECVAILELGFACNNAKEKTDADVQISFSKAITFVSVTKNALMVNALCIAYQAAPVSNRASGEDVCRCVARQRIAPKYAGEVIVTWNAQERNANRFVQQEGAI